ncbi:MAG: AIR synthase-related protein [Candidatus Pacebacteria bacterium]|nr:AIR synthase-related protein [Candidatus Paceibacterota bacterium]
MNPEAASLEKVVRDLGFHNLKAADTSIEYHIISGFLKPTNEEIETILNRLLINETTQTVIKERPKTLIIEGCVGKVFTVPIRHLNDEQLSKLSSDGKLHLNLEEMNAIQNYFQKIGRDLTDAELETIAQTWSEHCGHKTFKSKLIIDGKEKEPLINRLKKVSALYSKGVLSSFVDNSGAAEFYEGMAICGKVETHNSPSAIAPEGGAATGSGGVFRDIMGTGQGAKVIASTDMFCLAPPSLAEELLPEGCLPPENILRNVIKGVGDYGNRMGIPTNNGSLHFHDDFRAKPSVIVGAYGIIPAGQCKKGSPRPGDKIIAVGGRTGRDGIHGATFSSGEMTDKTISVNSAAVQIGNAIEEKRMFDALLVCRDKGLIRAITDCGAGGFSSAIGEMGNETGVRVFLERAPLKYTGLAPWEIWISESQERMIVAVAPENVKEFISICAGYNVEAVELGEFTDSKRLIVTYCEKTDYKEDISPVFTITTVCDLDMEFLHNGLPQRVMVGKLEKGAHHEPSISGLLTDEDYVNKFFEVVSHLNVCSKEPIVRRYDHGVQGTNALPPYAGVGQDGPNDAVVLTPILGKLYGLIISHGLNPVLNKIDPYHGSIWAAVEALSNLVAVGGNYRESWLIDNFIWPFPDDESLADLNLSVDACVKIMHAFKIPFISGKDSLSSTYKGKQNGKNIVIKIPPVLCVSAFGKIPDVRKTITASFKKPGSFIVLLGKMDFNAMGGSVYYQIHGIKGGRVPEVDLKLQPKIFDCLHRLINEGKILAAHDISEGGIAANLAEMCFGGNKGAMLEKCLHPLQMDNNVGPDFILFNETPGCFLLEIDEYTYLTEGAEKLFRGLPHYELGRVTESNIIYINAMDMRYGGNYELNIILGDLKNAWKKPMQEVFCGL